MLRTLLLVVMLVGAVGVGGIAWLGMAPPPPPPPPTAEAAPQVPRAHYLVAARPLRTGALVRLEDLTAAEMEVTAAPTDAIRDSREARAELLGGMIRRVMPQGDPLRGGDVLRPGERGFLAAVIAPEMRAFAVSVDAVTGAAGLIWPGDRVDLLLTQQLNDEAVPAYRRLFGETVLTDVRVIAVDTAILQGAMGEGPDANRSSRTVTLELSARQAEVAAVASRLGRLSLLLRSAADAVVDAPPAPQATNLHGSVFVRTLSDAGPRSVRLESEPSPVWGGDVSPGLRQGRADSAAPKTVQIFSGGSRREEFRF